MAGNEAINQSCNRLLPLHEINITDGYLVLMEENQGVCRWGIATANLAQDNPPAHIAFNTAASGDYRWQPHLPDTCALLLELACINATMGGLPYYGALVLAREAVAVHDEGGTHRDRDADAGPAKSDTYYYYNIRNRLLYTALQLDAGARRRWVATAPAAARAIVLRGGDRKSTRLNSSHRSEEHTSELQSLFNLVCRLLLEKKK